MSSGMNLKTYDRIKLTYSTMQSLDMHVGQLCTSALVAMVQLRLPMHVGLPTGQRRLRPTPTSGESCTQPERPVPGVSSSAYMYLRGHITIARGASQTCAWCGCARCIARGECSSCSTAYSRVIKIL